MILSDRRPSLESLARVGILAPKEGRDGRPSPRLNTDAWKRSKAEPMFNMLLCHERPALHKHGIMLLKFDRDEHKEALQWRRGVQGRLMERTVGLGRGPKRR